MSLIWIIWIKWIKWIMSFFSSFSLEILAGDASIAAASNSCQFRRFRPHGRRSVRSAPTVTQTRAAPLVVAGFARIRARASRLSNFSSIKAQMTGMPQRQQLNQAAGVRSRGLPACGSAGQTKQE
jgi:hypothetical protein